MFRFSQKQSVMQESGSGVVTKEKPEPFPIYSSPFPSLSHLSFPSPCHPFPISPPPPSLLTALPILAQPSARPRPHLKQGQTLHSCKPLAATWNQLLSTHLYYISKCNPCKKPFMLNSKMVHAKSNTIAHMYCTHSSKYELYLLVD